MERERERVRKMHMVATKGRWKLQLLMLAFVGFAGIISVMVVMPAPKRLAALNRYRQMQQSIVDRLEMGVSSMWTNESNNREIYERMLSVQKALNSSFRVRLAEQGVPWGLAHVWKDDEPSVRDMIAANATKLGPEDGGGEGAGQASVEEGDVCAKYDNVIDPWPFYKAEKNYSGNHHRWPGVGWSHLSVEDPNFREGFKFYMYEDELFDTERHEKCFFQRNKIPLDFEDPRVWDSRLSIVTRLYAPELRMWKVLRSHKQRTHKPEEAQLFIVGYSPIVGQVGPCPGVDWKEYELNVSIALRASPWWRRNQGQDHMMFWMKYNENAEEHLLEVMNEGILLGTSDNFFWNLFKAVPKPYAKGTTIVMPYMGSTYIDAVDAVPTDVGAKNSSSRYFFRGMLNRRGGKRGTLMDLQKLLKNTDFQDIRFPYQPTPPLLVSFEKSIRSSDMCLCPQGDAPTSGRVFEALAAGCAPIILSPKDLMPFDLPFPSLLKWDQIALFTDSFSKITEKPNGLEIFAKLLEALPEERLRCIQRRARVAFFKYMSYFKNPEGITDATLFEAWVLLQKRHVIKGPHSEAKAITKGVQVSRRDGTVAIPDSRR